jgi:hypothetical protein
MSILLRCVFILLLASIPLAFSQKSYIDGSVCSPSSSDERRWMKQNAQYLAALRESSLCKSSKQEFSQSYRFIWLRTFHHPVAVRLDIERNGIAVLTTKITSGRGGYSPGSIILNRHRQLTKKQTALFLKQIDALGFWALPRIDEPFSVGNDGAEWMIEGIKDSEYHVVHRWSPKDGPVRDIGLALAIHLGRLNIPSGEIY